jgi:hypothetical protein
MNWYSMSIEWNVHPPSTTPGEFHSPRRRDSPSLAVTVSGQQRPSKQSGLGI